MYSLGLTVVLTEVNQFQNYEVIIKHEKYNGIYYAFCPSRLNLLLFSMKLKLIIIS